jgi:hypothetical protein
VAEFDAGRRRLIEQAQDVKATFLERLRCQEALVAVSVGRNPQHHLQGLGFAHRQVRVLEQVEP